MLKRFMKKVILLVILGVFIGYGWYSYQVNRVYELPITQLEISSGLGVKQISAELLEAGYIHNDFLFRVYVWQKGVENKFIAGLYELPKETSMAGLVEILTSSQTKNQSVKLTFIEGWSVEDIAKYLNNKFGHDENVFYKLVGYPFSSPENNEGITTYDDSFESEYSFLLDRPDGVGYEGYIFPDTYLVDSEATLQDILRKAFDNFDVKLSDQMRADIKKQNKTIYEIVTIASILESEFRDAEDKKIGAGIINNRLDIGMALQMDSTVNYITDKNLPSVTFQDLEVDSKYNTYKYAGLPPGPIANPGLDSLVAAIYPAETDYLYFLHDAKGNTYFAKTFAEHSRNKQKYLK